MATSKVGTAGRISHKGRILLQCENLKPRAFPVEIYEDLPTIDFEKDPSEICRDVLVNVLNHTDNSKLCRLSYLNQFVRFITEYPRNKYGWGFTFTDILLCIRCLLADKEREIRTGSIRVLRYLIQSTAEFQLALDLKLDILLTRCLDVVLDNNLERMQCIRFVSHVAKICPEKINNCLIRCLFSISNYGFDDKDKLCQSSLAILCELVLSRPELIFQMNGFGWLIGAILGSSTTRLVECLVALINRLLNYSNFSKIRELLIGRRFNIYHEIFTVFVDSQYKISGSDNKDDKVIRICKNETELMLENCKTALNAALISWPGYFTCFAQEPKIGHKSPIKTIIDSFNHVNDQLREAFVDTLCTVLNFAYKNQCIDSWEKALEASEFANNDDFDCLINQKFVLADFENLSHSHYNWIDNRLDLNRQIQNLVVCGLLENSLIDALLHYVIENPETSLSFKILLFLSDLNEKFLNDLPIIWQSKYNSFAAVVNQICDTNGTAVTKQSASLIIHRLETLSTVKRKLGPTIRTLELESLLERYCDRDSSHSTKNVPKILKMAKNSQEVIRMQELIKESRVSIDSVFTTWNWSLIHLILLEMSNFKQIQDDSIFVKFFGQLLNFFNVKSGLLCRLSQNELKNAVRVGCLLMRVLTKTKLNSALNSEFISFLRQFENALSEDQLSDGPLSSKNLLSSINSAYFLLLGEISSIEKGIAYLEQCGIIQRLNDLLSSDTHEVYTKLILSSFDFSESFIIRSLLQKALVSAKLASRLYATKFLCILGKLKVNGFKYWGIDLLIHQLFDTSVRVITTATRVLEDLLIYDPYREAFISKRPILTPLGDVGVLLKTYLFSNPEFIASPKSMDFIDTELDFWQKEFNLKYATIVNELLQETFTNCQRTANGQFSRHSSRENFQHAILPPHLYGQMVKHESGSKLLLTHRNGCIVKNLLKIVHYGTLNNEKEIWQLKSALWAVGHILSSDYGFNCLPKTVVLKIVKICLYCPLFSMRGVAFYVLNLMSRSELGSRLVTSLGWLCSNSNHKSNVDDVSKNLKSDFLLKNDQNGFYEINGSLGGWLNNINKQPNFKRRSKSLRNYNGKYELNNFLDLKRTISGENLHNFDSSHEFNNSLIRNCNGNLMDSKLNLQEKSSSSVSYHVEKSDCERHSALNNFNPDVYTICLPPSINEFCLLNMPHSDVNSSGDSVFSNQAQQLLAFNAQTNGRNKLGCPKQRFFNLKSHSSHICFNCEQNLTDRNPKIDSNDSKTNVVYSYYCSSEPSSPPAEPGNKNLTSVEMAAVKEALKLICVIDVRRSYAEQGLLKLKQEVPQIFQSLCFYADICFLMGEYNFRANSRRFLQELFLDSEILLSSLWLKAERVISGSTSNTS